MADDKQKHFGANLYTIPPGVPFLSTFAKNLLNGTLFPDFKYDENAPHKLAKALIYVPTRRAARELRSEISDLIGKGSIILPDIKPLGETDEDLGFFENDVSLDLTERDPISKIQSSLILGELIYAWKQSLPAVFDQQLKSVPLVAPANPADAIWLADELLGLIEAAENEEIDLKLIDKIDTQEHAQWWKLTLEFLKIAREFWPIRLDELNRQSSAQNQISMLDKHRAQLEMHGHDGPIIVAGSTGSLPATARLIKTVATLKNGAVILPGLDQKMGAKQWASIFDIAASRTQTGFGQQLNSIVIQGHPQFGLARLLSRIGLNETHLRDVQQLGDLNSNLELRHQLVSKAMLPAFHTDIWSHPDDTDNVDDQARAFEGVSLIEAANTREEAAAIGAAIRLALEPVDDVKQPNVALVTPDRNLARMVALELTRYGIEADDSGGLSLDQTEIGALTRTLLQVALKPADNTVLAGMLKHRFANFGMEFDARLKAVSTIERLVLRGRKKALPISQLSTILRSDFDCLSDQKHVPLWRRFLTLDDIDLAEILTEKLTLALAPLMEVGHADSGLVPASELVLSVSQWTNRTIKSLQLVTDSFDGAFALWDNDAGQKLVSVLEEIAQCPTSLEVTGREWVDMIEPLLSGQVVKPKTGKHPNVLIWGALEARLQDVDTLILAGLNEGTWPSTSSNDPFLSRTMKSEIGLEPPERRLGLAAHDFQIGMGSRRVVLTRALKSGGAPTVASRWVQRLLTVLADDVVAHIRDRGQDLIKHADLVQDKSDVTHTKRPSPTPEKSVQPRSYSFSEVSTLRRDPYAIYAKRILRLQPLDGFTTAPDLRERGTIFHAIVEKFSQEFDFTKPENAQDYLQNILNIEVQNFSISTDIALLWKHSFMQVSQALINWELQRQDFVQTRYVEQSAKCKLPDLDDVYLTGRADRIDVLLDGSTELIDFKTGTSPSAKQARSLLDPQLPLEAYAMEQGGFKDIGKRDVSSMKYVRLKPADTLIVDQVELKATKKEPEPATPPQLGENAARELSKLLTALAQQKVGFISRAVPKSDRDYGGDYDHLARVSEWSVAEASEEGDDHE
jgi:ATP-dependent helicase/nuclease subunit B